MGTPTNRTPVRVARGSTTALNTGLSDIQEGEIVWDTTLNKLQVKEGAALENHTVDTSTLAPKASPTFTGAVQNNATVTVGVDDTGHDVKFFGATAGKYFLWDESADKVMIDGAIDVTGEMYACGNDIHLRQLSANVGQITVDHTTADQLVLGGNSAVYLNDLSTTPSHSNLTIDWDGNITATGSGVSFAIGAGDADTLFEFKNSYAGTSGVYHGWIENTSPGDIYIRGEGDVYIQDSGNSNADWLKCVDGGAVELSHAGTKKLETTSTGVTVTGTVTATAGVLGVGDALLASDQNWTGAQRGNVNTLTSAASITIDFGVGNNFKLETGHGTISFANPTTEVAGQSGSIFIVQGSTTCAAPSWGDQYLFPGGTAPSLTGTTGKIARIDYIVQEAGKIHCVATDNLALTS